MGCYGLSGRRESGVKKDFTRDYATEAFRLYAAMGKLSVKDIEKNSEDEANRESGAQPEVAYFIKKNKTEKMTPLLLDIMAVEKTIEILEVGGKIHIVRAVADVYFVQPAQPLRRGDITMRVRRHSLTAFVSERNVYLWLKQARLLFASLRGLRISDGDAEKIKFAVVDYNNMIQ